MTCGGRETGGVRPELRATLIFRACSSPHSSSRSRAGGFRRLVLRQKELPSRPLRGTDLPSVGADLEYVEPARRYRQHVGHPARLAPQGQPLPSPGRAPSPGYDARRRRRAGSLVEAPPAEVSPARRGRVSLPGGFPEYVRPERARDRFAPPVHVGPALPRVPRAGKVVEALDGRVVREKGGRSGANPDEGGTPLVREHPPPRLLRFSRAVRAGEGRRRLDPPRPAAGAARVGGRGSPAAIRP
ncbi:MAG: hypothetical protein KatS3mg076_0808 [Candidatus Binatia bacterium]|nr:MAG: hypothetical protein KatS3mg076_0808 [Candidatus Binatia bacterium]